MSKIKICGLSRMEDIHAVNNSMPDFVGFVFAKKSRRYVEPEVAERLKRELKKEILAVGVFVDAPNEEIAELADRRIMDLIQLHGKESTEDILWLKEQTGRKIIKAVSVSPGIDLDRWKECPADYILFDQGGGGTGKTFDWSLVADFPKPYFLAGGLDLNNIRSALKCNAYALDLSGGAETDGVKNPEKIEKLVQIAHGDR